MCEVEMEGERKERSNKPCWFRAFYYIFYLMTITSLLQPGPGDIQELYRTKLAPGHAAAFATDCDLPSTHEIVRSVGMQVS